MKSLLSWRFASNYLSTMLFAIAAYWVCFELSNFHKGMLGAHLYFPPDGIPVRTAGWLHGLFASEAPRWTAEGFMLTAQRLFLLLIVIYGVVLIDFYRRYPWVHAKTYVFLRGVWLGLARPADPEKQRRKGGKPRPARLRHIIKKKLSPKTRQAGLAMLLKFFFAPLMINWCLGHVIDMGQNIELTWNNFRDGMVGRVLFDNGLFWACFQLILFIDTLLFTLGYIIETPALKNRIVSVEPTFIGWFVCLACYPPFNECTGRFFEWQSNDFPHFQSDNVHLFFNVCILALMGIYSWASVALGFKASNLTNRGIVGHGPYRFVRHPAYAAKNLAWWIGALPTFYMAFGGGLRGGLYALACTAAWSFMYYMRALTEEQHLMRANNGYQEYKARVKYRFIPGLI